MRRDGRLSSVVHILLHMAGDEAPVTSDDLAKIVRTNPVVIRRLLAKLRDAGLVRSEKGHGGGWTVACDLSSTSLEDIYVALGKPALFAMSNSAKTPDCLFEQAVNAALDDVFREAEVLLLERFNAVTLADLSADYHRRVAALRPKGRKGKKRAAA